MFKKSEILKREVFKFYSTQAMIEIGQLKMELQNLYSTYSDGNKVAVIDELIKLYKDENSKLFRSISNLLILTSRESSVFSSCGDDDAAMGLNDITRTLSNMVGNFDGLSLEGTITDKNEAILLQAKKIQFFDSLYSLSVEDGAAKDINILASNSESSATMLLIEELNAQMAMFSEDT